MAYIHETDDWPNFIWEAKSLVHLLADVRYKQGRLLGKMQSLGFDVRDEACLTTLTADVLKSSAIEGEMLDQKEVRSSVARRLGLDVGGNSKVSRHVEGIVEMSMDATRNFQAELTSERLFGWHAALFPTGRSGMTPITVGSWRRPEGGPMRVVSGPLGREKVHFEAPPAERVDAEVKMFLEWFELPTTTDSVLKAAVAHFWFVTIHPFDDGNGRIARAIADLALARGDGTKDRFYSMSSQLEAERKDYYANLEFAQRGDVDITRWVTWFVGCLGRAVDAAEQTLEAVLQKAMFWQRINRRPVNDRQRIVIKRMLNGFKGHLTTSKYAKLAKCSTDTALRDIRELLARGILLQNSAGGRSTSYRLGEASDIGSS